MRRHHHGPHCGCPTCVYPTKVNTVNTCSESAVKHVHPSHTNVVNHHTVKNVHEFPHSTSYQNVTNSVDIMGPQYQVPAPPAPGAGFGPVAGAGFGPGAGAGFGPGAGAGFGPGAGAGFGPGAGAGFGPGAGAGFGPGAGAGFGPGAGAGFGPGAGAGFGPGMAPGYGMPYRRR